MADSKVDFKKSFDSYRPGRHHELRTLVVPPRQYLMIDGAGDPNGPGFPAAVGTLFPAAYAMKFASRTELGRDYVVPPLEALWWSDDPATFTVDRDKSRWNWTLLSLLPDWIDRSMLERTVEARGLDAARVLRLETLDEGLCVQTLHVGPFDDEAAILHEMHHGFLERTGHELTGRHHEVYFSDLRRVPPARLRTLLRQPIRPLLPTREPVPPR